MNPNSSNIWLPRIEAAELPVPRTQVVPYNHGDIMPIFDGEDCPAFAALLEQVRAAAQVIGYPIFLRTDLGSAKHTGPRAYKAEGEKDIGNVLFRLIEDQEMKFWTEMRGGPTAILVREFLDLDAQFTAFGGLPIAREWRFFATAEGALCAHPYWPVESLEGHTCQPGYKDLLADHHKRTDGDEHLERMAKHAAATMPGGEWSVDFARDRFGKWWLIDMATAADSYHWPTCDRVRGAIQIAG